MVGVRRVGEGRSRKRSEGRSRVGVRVEVGRG